MQKQSIYSFTKSFSKAAKVIIAFCMVACCNFVYGQNRSEVTTITITNARQTSYKKAEDSGNDIILLEGAVELSVSKGNTSSEIKAEKITYDRNTEMLYAEGSVEIKTKSSSAGGETTTAAALLMNTATLEGVFDDGRVVQTQSDAINLPSGSTLVVFSDIFGKSENNTIAFKNSSLTFCDDENPHWHIDATRTWLLPGGEFAFFNALLYVGPVPVLYLPAFYYPKDELVFNPVFGQRRREGYFIQTTTYLYGRKPLSGSGSQSSESDSASTESLKALYNFMKPSSLKKQELQGLVLHNLDEDFTGDTTNYFKVMADWYANLGGMVGVDGVFHPNSYISNLNFNLNLGFSTTIFNDKGSYLPYSKAYKKYWDKSNFLGLKLPFRYGANVDFTLAKPFKLSLNLPLYSDPYFSYDFKTRDESMDWISYFTSAKDDEVNVTEVSSYSWKLTSSYSPTIPEVLKPYISSVSASINSSVLISSVDNTNLSEDERSELNDGWRSFTPERKFYYPSQVTPGSVSASVSGTLFQWPMVSSSKKSNSVNFKVPLTKPQEFLTQKDIENLAKEEEEALRAAQEAAKAEAAEENLEQTVANEITQEKIESELALEEEKIEFVLPVLPELTTTSSGLKNISGLTYRLSYSFSPNLNTQFAYATTDYDENEKAFTYLKEPTDFKWSKVKSFMYTLKAPVSLNSAFNYGGNFFSINNKVAYDPSWQAHPNSDGYTKAQKKTLVYSDYSAQSQTVTNTNSLSLKPFTYLPNFADTGISWNSTMKLFRRKFNGKSDDPDWETNWEDDWEYYKLDFEDPDSITAHTLDVVLAANQMSSKFKQTFTFSSTLKPQVPKYSGALNLVFPYVNASVNTSIQQKSKDDDTWVKNPLQQSASVSLFDSNLRLTQSLSYNLEEKYWDSLKFSTSWKMLSASYVMSRTYGYDFDEEAGWIVRDEKEFLPYSFSFSFSPASKTYYSWFNRISISPGLNTSITADLIRPTSSYFSITPSLSFKINEFFNFTFSSTSQNSVLYRYFQSALGHEGRIPGEQNVFVDLWNSFRFDNEEVRKSSGFKLKSLKMDVSHELHDWSFKMSFKFEPRLITEDGVKHYDYNPYITIGVVWNPMESMKASIVDNYGEWKFE